MVFGALSNIFGTIAFHRLPCVGTKGITKCDNLQRQHRRHSICIISNDNLSVFSHNRDENECYVIAAEHT